MRAEDPALWTSHAPRRETHRQTEATGSGCPLPECLEYETEKGRLYPFIQRTKVSVGDGAEVISPRKIGRAFKVEELYSEKGEPIESAPHPAMKFFVRVPFDISAGDIMRAGEEE